MCKTKKHFLFSLYNKIKAIIKPGKIYPVIYNANRVDESNYTKYALLIYIVQPFLVRDDDPSLLRHHNARKCIQIASILDELGYIVDVVDLRDSIFWPSREYDLVLSNRASDITLKTDAIKIYIATTSCHKTHNNNLRNRHKRLQLRRGCQVQPRRLAREKVPYVMKSDAIIGIGRNAFTWKEVFMGPIYQFNNYGYKETEFPADSKDFDRARKNFLFFASQSQVLKGLDLLLEIFPKHPQLHLYICSNYTNEEDFCACYHKELYETPNIHPIGRVRVNGPEYNELVRKCACVILPSCSEGQSSSVVQCMYSGLIPLVTKEVGIDTEDFGVTFLDDSLEEIERVIVEVSELSVSWHREHSFRTREVSEEKYSEDLLTNSWRHILTEIINNTVSVGAALKSGDKIT